MEPTPARRGLAALALGAALAAAAPLAASAVPASPAGDDRGGARATLERYAADTWASFVAMTDPATGLPADNIEGDLTAPSGYTSPTNIGGYLWSTIAARDLGIIGRHEARDRLRTTLDTLAAMERHVPSGMYYNWYAPATAEKLTAFPSGETIFPFLSSVDNGWLAASLRVVAEADPSLRRTATTLYDAMDFSWFHDPEAREGLGLNRGGFWLEPPVDPGTGGPGCTVPGNYGPGGAGPDVHYTCHWYDTTVSETRIATYLGIANGQIAPEAYFATYRTMPDAGCDFAWQEQKPVGRWREYRGVDVFEGAYRYAGMALVPGWGGSMFEALMPDLFLPEAEWGPESWGVNHPATVRAQIHHGLEEAGYGAWGFSPASDPFAEYREYGVEAIGIQSEGYASDVERTDVDLGYEGCRDATNPEPEFGDGVVTPHAAFLALPYARDDVMANLDHLERAEGAYGPGGFYDAVAVGSDTVAERYLSLDQAMIMGAILNELEDDALADYFVDRRLEKALRPLVAEVRFSASLG